MARTSKPFARKPPTTAFKLLIAGDTPAATVFEADIEKFANARRLCSRRRGTRTHAFPIETAPNTAATTMRPLMHRKQSDMIDSFAPAHLKLVRFPARSPLPIAALPSMSLIPFVPFPHSRRVDAPPAQLRTATLRGFTVYPSASQRDVFYVGP